MELTIENLQEIDDIAAICAGMNDEDHNSWIEQLDLNNTQNTSGVALIEEKMEKPKESENFNEILDHFKRNVEKIIEDDGLLDGSYIKNYIEYCAEKDVESALNLIDILKQPVKEEYKHFELDIDDIVVEFIEPEIQKPKALTEKRKDLLKMPKNKFIPVKSHYNSILSDAEIDTNTKTPILTNIHSPLRFTKLKNASTPIRMTSILSEPFIGFHPDFEENSPTRMESKSPVKNMSISANKITNQSKNSHLNQATNESVQNKLEFLGILSIEDIFEGCDSQFDLNSFEKCSNSVEKSQSIQNEAIECSIAEPIDNNKVLTQFNVNDFSDFFEMTAINKSVKELENDILQHEQKDDENVSDSTQIYDVEDEIAKIEDSHKDIKSNFVGFDLREQYEMKQECLQNNTDDLFLKKTDSKPNLSKLMNAIESSSSFGQIAKENNMLQSLEYTSRFCTPPNQEITNGSCESTPDILNTSNDRDNFKSTAVRRRIVRKQRNAHNSFLQTQADVDGHYGSSDEDEDHDSSLNGFVCHENIHDESMMHAKYLKSIQSPSAVRNGRFVLRQLQPVNLSDFYSQAVNEESDNSDIDSFIVDDEDDTVDSELDELELAEQALTKQRKRKYKQQNGYKKKMRKVFIADSDSSDEGDELRKLRDEVFANPD